jgi:hypothetical protein
MKKARKIGKSSGLTYEQLKPALEKWGNFFAKYFYSIEKDELINAVWEKGDVQKLKRIQFASERIRWDMIDYIRQVNKSRMAARWEASGKHFPKFKSIHNVLYSQDVFFLSVLPAKPDLHNDPEIRDLFDYITKGMTRESQLMIKLYYLKGFNHAEIARVIGCAESLISMRMKVFRIITARKLNELGYEGVNYEKNRSNVTTMALFADN